MDADVITKYVCFELMRIQSACHQTTHTTFCILVDNGHPSGADSRLWRRCMASPATPAVRRPARRLRKSQAGKTSSPRRARSQLIPPRFSRGCASVRSLNSLRCPKHVPTHELRTAPREKQIPKSRCQIPHIGVEGGEDFPRVCSRSRVVRGGPWQERVRHERHHKIRWARPQPLLAAWYIRPHRIGEVGRRRLSSPPQPKHQEFRLFVTIVMCTVVITTYPRGRRSIVQTL